MSSAVKQQDAAPLDLRAVYAPIETELAEVERILQSELRSRFPRVDEMVRYGFQLGGKRLRPALLLLSAKAVGEVTRDHLLLAAVVEMIHTATLVHDDVLDEADVRRHLATANTRWNNEASVLLGDFLFTHAFYLASTLDSTWACRMIGRATNVVCEGELRQIANRGNFALSESEYLDIVGAKTAELCACCCQLGAHYAGADEETTQRLSRYGHGLGTAFQIADDLLDVVGDERQAGKSLGTDLEKQKPTLPLIHTLKRAGTEQRERILAILQNGAQDRRRDLMPWMKRFGAVGYARGQARAFATSARGELACLSKSPALESLILLTKFVVLRSH